MVTQSYGDYLCQVLGRKKKKKKIKCFGFFDREIFGTKVKVESEKCG